jgi:PleD family two-component response regulator
MRSRRSSTFREASALDGQDDLPGEPPSREVRIECAVFLGEIERLDVRKAGARVGVGKAYAGVLEKAVVVFATARDSQLDRLSGLELGAADYETKPFHFDTLFHKIKNLLEKKRRGEI